MLFCAMVWLVQIVIGSGPAAQKCAIDSAKRGKRVAMIDKNSQFGGVCVVSGNEGLSFAWYGTTSTA